MLLKQFLTMARKSVPKGGILDGGYAEEMFRSMQDDELAKNLARNKGVGFGDMLYRELTKTTKQTDRG